MSEQAARQGPATCVMCGGRPTAEVTLRRNVGMVFRRRTETVEGPLCRRCGLATFREMTDRTLWQGWWGLVSFFANWTYVARNLLARRRLGELPPPAPASRDAEGRQGASADPGPPLFRRKGIYIAAVLVLVIVGGGVAGALGEAGRSETGEITRGGELDVLDLRVGDCFDDVEQDSAGTATVPAVPCAAAHDNEVFAAFDVPGGESAPFPGEAAVEEESAGCRPRFEEFVGVAYERSVLEMFVFYPTEDSWGIGDRAVVCAVYDPGGPVTGTLRDAGR